MKDNLNININNLMKLFDKLNPDDYVTQSVARTFILQNQDVIEYLLEHNLNFSANHILKRYVDLKKLWECIENSNFANLTELELSIVIVLLYSKSKFTKINFIIEAYKDKLNNISRLLGEIYADLYLEIVKNAFSYLLENIDKDKLLDCVFNFVHGVSTETAENCIK